jgi:hypothetical protein
MASAASRLTHRPGRQDLATELNPIAEVAMGTFVHFAVTVSFNIPSKWDEMIKKK